MTTFHFYSDPGHGWLKVPRKLLHDLNIANHITPYSYQRGDYVYLEEDSDLSRFMRAWNATEKPAQIIHHTGNRTSCIRKYERYQP